MPTTRQYTFDIDTKRYLNRVNTYRLLNGLPNITNGDAVDIDNFVIGLKDLGLWHKSTFWIMNSNYNVGAGSIVLPIGGWFQYDAPITGNATWSLSGIYHGGTSGGVTIRNVPSINNFSIFGCCNALLSNPNPFYMFAGISKNYRPMVQNSGQTGTNRLVIFNSANVSIGVNDNSVTNYQSAFRTFQGNFSPSSIVRYDNSSLRTISRTNDATDTCDYVVGGSVFNNQNFGATIFTPIFGLVTGFNTPVLFNLYKATIGKNLNLGI